MHDINPYWFITLVPVALGVEYACCYAVLRLWGKLAVNRESWHAERLGAWGLPVVPALVLFRFFHVPMRVESRLRRLLARPDAGTQSEMVSDVAVELVSFA